MDIRPATPGERAFAASRLVGAGSRDRMLDLIATGRFDSRDLLVAVDDGKLRGAIIAQVLPGHLAVMVPPSADDPATADALVHAALTHLERHHVRLAQAYLDAAADPSALERHGFHFATQIEQWVMASHGQQEQGDAVPLFSASLQFTQSFDRSLFSAALLETFEGSLDAPEANIGASAEEIDAGYAAKSERWLVLENQQPVGLLITSRVATFGEIEYLGVVPSARHRGIGHAILNHAVHTFQRSGVERITVSVDGRNQPARRLYGRFGFRCSRTQNLWLLRLPRP